MKTLSLLLGSALTVLALCPAAMAQDAGDPSMMTCAEFLAMDAAGMASASEAVAMAGDAMAGDAMAVDAMAGDAMADDAMAGDAMADDAMAGDTVEGITAACTAHPDAKVVDALAM